jgi:hypothetical protein
LAAEVQSSERAGQQGSVARSQLVPFRAKPDQEDTNDQERVQLVTKRWKSQDAAYLGFSKTVEEHIRMLSGRQWDVWSEVLGRFVDVLQYMSEDERKHRMRPVMDYLGYWFLLTLSKASENPPVVSFLPATSDRLDAMLAEVMDPIWKTLFDEMEMDARTMRAISWALVAGEAHAITRVDFSSGSPRKLIAPAVLSLDRADGTSIERIADAVPYGSDGNPLAQLVEDPENEGQYGYDVTGDPYEDREGSPKVDIPCPLQVRAQWGQHIPWRDKRWIAHEWFLTPEEVEQQFGVKCDPDHYPADDERGPGYLERMLFGAGYYGAARSEPVPVTGYADGQATHVEGFVRGITMWEKPIDGFSDETDDAEDGTPGSPGGRLLVVVPSAHKVLWDSKRPFRTECAGPIRRMAFIEIPGRPFGSTPLEKLVPLQKRLNRIEAQIAEHTNLCTNPILMKHEACGIDDDEFEARPGLILTHGYNGAGRAAEWLAPPQLSGDVWRHKADVREQLFTIGAMAGNQSEAPTQNSSGELVEQLRFNADRPLAPLTRNLVLWIADVAEDVLAVLPTIWTEEKVIAYSGSDNVIRTVTVLPEMFSGRVNVKPSIESAGAESKEKKQSRLIQLYQLGAFGNIADPAQQPRAAMQLLQLIQFPDLNRASRPGGVDRVMAEHNLGRLVRGEEAQAIPLLEVYDFSVHQAVTEEFMKAPEYMAQDQSIQQQFVVFHEMILLANQVKQMNAIQRAMPLAQAQAVAQGHVQGVGASAGVASGPAPTEAPGAPAAGPHSPSSPPRQDSRAA